MLNEKVRNYIILIVSILIAFGIGFYFGNNNKVSSTNLSDSAIFLNEETDTSKIKVFISGEVRNSGVYELGKGDRVIDLIDKAGGIKEIGDLEAINPARVLKDGESIIIPPKISLLENDGSDLINTTRSSNDNIININKADLEELKKLPGIGDVKAQAIIDYRDMNGPFTDIEELKEVSGIGDKTFEKIKDQITIDKLDFYNKSFIPILVFSFILGICTFFLFDIFKSFTLILLILIFLLTILTVVIFKISFLIIKKILVVFIILLFGFYLTNLRKPFIDSHYYVKDKEIDLIGKIVSNPINIDRNTSFKVSSKKLIILVKIKDSLKQENKLKVYLRKGAYVKLRGKIDDINKKFPDGNDYKGYILNLRCNGAIVCEENGLIGIVPTQSLIEKITTNTRSFFIKNINKNVENKEFAEFLKAIVIGEQNIDFYNRERFSELGIVHILSISGMHFSILAAILFFILILFGIKSPINEITIIILLSSFLFLIGFIPSAIRAFIMILFTLISRIIKRVDDAFVGLTLAAFIILFIDPWLIRNIGFQLSFISTLALVIIHGKLNRFIGVGLAAVPLVAYSFNIVSYSSIISNLFLVPFLPFFYIYGMFISFFGFIKITFFNSVFLLSWKFFSRIIEFIAGFKISYKYIPDINYLVILIYYILFLFLSLTIYYSDKYKYKITQIMLLSLILLSFSATFILNTISPDNLMINFIDVGQGDSTLIRTPNGMNILIDSGKGKTETSNYDNGEKVILPILKRYGINKLDLVIISHYHDDHYGGLLSLIDHVPKIENIIVPKYKSVDSLNFYKLFKQKRRNINLIEICGNKRMKIPGDIYFEFFTPFCDKNELSNLSENSRSIVFKLSYKKISVLFTGDVEQDTEKKLIKQYGNEIDADFLKVPHHGSATSSSQEFLNVVTPIKAVISCGPKWIFNHPAQSVINRFNNLDIDWYSTYEKGSIILQTDGTHFRLKSTLD